MIISSYIFETLWNNILDTSLLEFIAVIFGLLSVWYAKQEKILVYPTGIVNVLISVYICFGQEIYADAGINLFYFVMSIYGWIKWTKKSNTPILKISVCTMRNWYFAVGLFISSGLIVFILLKFFKTNDPDYWSSALPYTDTITTAIFIVGMWLMAIKKLENWLFWIAGDIISVPLYISRDLAFMGFQFLIFLVIAIMGYISWRKKIIESQSNIANRNQKISN